MQYIIQSYGLYWVLCFVLMCCLLINYVYFVFYYLTLFNYMWQKKRKYNEYTSSLGFSFY